MIKYLAPLVLILLIGCNKFELPKKTYFGGKIINPKTGYVILSNNYNFNDTIYLKKDNSFLSSYKKLKKGLYIFKHGIEHQYVYLESQDSLLLRLNTWDFDESLVFSGKNAERNNLLIETYLQTEKDKKEINKFKSLTQEDFVQKIDSIKSIKQQIIDNYQDNTENIVSNDFIEILNISLLYPIYTRLEEYATQNFKKDKTQKLSTNYFNYRNNLNLKRDSLIFFGPYYRLLFDKLRNDVYLNENNNDNFTINLLNAIDKNIATEEIKNKILYNTTVRNFFKNPNQKNKDKIFFTFFKLNTNNDQKKNVQRLINDLKLLNVGNKITPFALIDAMGNKKNILDITKNKNSVILFKDYEYTSDEWIASRTNYLIKNNPEVNFIIVNLCNSKEYTKRISLKHQYTLPKKSNVCNFSTSKFPRIVLLDKKGIIKNGYTSLFSKEIGSQIKRLQKNK